MKNYNFTREEAMALVGIFKLANENGKFDSQVTWFSETREILAEAERVSGVYDWHDSNKNARATIINSFRSNDINILVFKLEMQRNFTRYFLESGKGFDIEHSDGLWRRIGVRGKSLMFANEHEATTAFLDEVIMLSKPKGE